MSNYSKGVTIVRRELQDVLKTLNRDAEVQKYLKHFDAASQLGSAQAFLKQIIGNVTIYEDMENK